MRDAYSSRGALDRLFYLLDREFDSIAAEWRDHEDLILGLLKTAEKDGWADELVRAAVDGRPKHVGLREWTRDNLPTSDELGPAVRGHIAAPVITFDLNELRKLCEEAVGKQAQLTLDSVKISVGAATFFISQQGAERLITLLVEATPLVEDAERANFLRMAGRTQEAVHPRVAGVLAFGFTSTGLPYLVQMVDQRVENYPLSLPAHDVIDIGAKLADALSVAHNWGTTFGEIDVSHVLRGADGQPILILPHLPMSSGNGQVALRPHEEVFRLGEILMTMLPADLDDDSSLEEKLRGLLSSAMRGDLIAAALRDRLKILQMESAPARVGVQALTQVPLNDGPLHGTVSIVTGDLFDQHGDIVVGFSDTFDTATAGSRIISSASLQGQLVDRIFGGDVNELDRALDSALAEVPVESVEIRDAKPLGKLRRYPIGTVAVLEREGRRIFAVAFSRMGNNLTAGSNAGFLRCSLNKLWDVMRPHCAGRTVAMPVIGAGLSRMGLSRQKLLELIIYSYRERAQVNPACGELRIVAHPSDLADADLLGIE